MNLLVFRDPLPLQRKNLSLLFYQVIKYLSIFLKTQSGKKKAKPTVSPKICESLLEITAKPLTP